MTTQYNTKVTPLYTLPVFNKDNQPEGFMSVFVVGFYHRNFKMKNTWVTMAIDNLGDELTIPHTEIVDNALILAIDEVESILDSEPTQDHFWLVKREKALKNLELITSNFSFSA